MHRHHGVFLSRLSAWGLVLAVWLLGGCGKPHEIRTSDGRVLIHYWEKWTGRESADMQDIVDDFNASQTRIRVEMLSVGQIEEKLMLATAGGDPPEVAGIWEKSICVYADKNALLPLSGMAKRAGITREDYIPIYWDMCCYKGFLWALPSAVSSLGLHWNKSLFRDAGLDPEHPPASLAELEAISDALTIVEVKRGETMARIRYPELTATEKMNKEFRLLQVGHLPQEPGAYRSQWTYWFGGSLTDGERKITATSPETIQAYQWYRLEAEKFGVENLRRFSSTCGTTGDIASPQSPFYAGKVAMVLQGIWMQGFIQKYAPQMEWGVAPFPASDPEKTPGVTIVDADVLVLPNGCRQPQEAFEFVRYVNSQKPMEKLSRARRSLSPRAQASEAFLAQHPNPCIQAYIALAKSPNAHTEPRVPVWLEYNNELWMAVDRVVSLHATPEDALDDVQKRIQRRYDRILAHWDLVKDTRLKEWHEHDAK